MDKFIFKMEVKEVTMPKKMNWLGSYDEKFKDEDFKENKYVLYFGTFEEMSNKIDEVTKGYHQYWADVTYDLYENNDEYLEYHNDYGAWDKEIYIDTSRLYLIDSFWKAIENYSKK
jgi:hypothetical protein